MVLLPSSSSWDQGVASVPVIGASVVAVVAIQGASVVVVVAVVVAAASVGGVPAPSPSQTHILFAPTLLPQQLQLLAGPYLS
eukprot:5838440-Ditylum_brightwellii.AAC.1